MTSREALDIIFSFVKNDPVVHATGFICRASQAVKDRPENFYMIGSMGIASSIALGVALTKPGKKVIALDGDGAVLMNMGSLATIGALKIDNLVHIVLDNESYESTGSQPSLSHIVRLEDVAKASGYAFSKKVTKPAELKKIMKTLFKKKGPSFLLIKVTEDKKAPYPRITVAPEEMTDRFSQCLAR